MSNGYVLADTDSLVYAYRGGSPKLLDANAPPTPSSWFNPDWRQQP